ncbi:MAG: hypothetical protein J6Y52_07970 [Bacteroidales bacterium]|nr:hypothetical protein [Bacteroidales bacterium]
MKPRGILLFMASVIAALAVIGEFFPADGIALGKRQLTFTSLHGLVAAHNNRADITIEAEPPEMLQLRDSVSYYRSLVNEGDMRFWLPDAHYLDAFWRTAISARHQGRTVRILHYGDSQIEMDHITSRLRAHMQCTFGGGGPGMVPFRTITPTLTVSQSTNGELIHISSFGDSTVVRSSGNYGPMMQCFRLGGNASTTLRGSKHKSVDDRAKRFSRITLIHNNRGNRLGAELADRQHKANYPQSTSESGISSLVWQLDSATTHVRLSVNGNADLYGVLVDDGPGVAVDNIPMRGCSGQQFTLIPEDKLTAAYAQMDIGLIILQFGGNSVPYLKTSKQVSTYCQSLGRQIDHIRLCCPKAKVLFIGPSDMSTRLKGQLQTYPIIPELIDSLAATATAHGAAFWSIYHAMGGHNSMPEWSRQGFAGQDYIHFSQRGADLMGDRLSQALDNSYRLYLLERKAKKSKSQKAVK